MSWDIFIQDLPDGIESVSQIPDDFRPATIGKRSDFIAAIQSILPETDFSDPAWGVFDGEGASIEFSMGDDEEVSSICLHVRGGSAAPKIVEKLLRHLGRQALDTGSGDLFRFGDESAEGFNHWRAYHDRVIGGEPDP